LDLIVGRGLDILNVPIHLKASKPLDIAGQVSGRDYTPLFVDSRIFCPAINYHLPGLVFLFQAGSNGRGVVWAKDTGDNFFRLLAALLNVYGRHIRSPRTAIGPLVLGQRLGGLCLGGLCLGGWWIKLLVTLDIGWQIGRARLPVSNWCLHAGVRGRQRSLTHGNTSSR
jgi:hypothetical protein